MAWTAPRESSETSRPPRARREARALLLSRRYDFVAFAGLLAGAVPLSIGLGVLLERHVLHAADVLQPATAYGLLLGAVAFFAAGSMTVLKRARRSPAGRSPGDHAQLRELRRAFRSMAAARTGTDAAESAARTAAHLTDASAAFVMLRSGDPAKPPLVASAGRDADSLLGRLEGPLRELSEIAAVEDRAMTIPAEGWELEGATAGAVCVLPLPGDREPLGALCVVTESSGVASDPAPVDALETLASFASMALRNAQLHHEQRNFFSHLTELLVRALDGHLEYHDGHSHRVAQYCHRLARGLGFEEAKLERLHFASLLHDIGMLRIDRRVRHDRQTCKAHPRLGERMLRGILVWAEVAEIVLHHHEWFDGSGYPDGLSGEAIPVEARIIAVCDAFDSITSDSSYKQSRSVAEAVREIEAGAGTQFDPQIARCFVGLVKQGEISCA